MPRLCVCVCVCVKFVRRKHERCVAGGCVLCELVYWQGETQQHTATEKQTKTEGCRRRERERERQRNRHRGTEVQRHRDADIEIKGTNRVAFLCVVYVCKILPYITTSNTVEVVYLDSKVKRLNTAPLCDQPGARFQYGVNTDVLGAVVEAVAGMSLGKYVTLRYGMLFVKGLLNL